MIRRLCSERSIVFKLGIYLAQEFEGTRFDVDCEYNKNGVKPKALLGKRTNFPDIIVHKREQNENNLLIIEVKTPNDTNQKHFEADREKLVGFTGEIPYLYQLGVHLYISGTQCRIVWYSQGKCSGYCAYKIKRDEHMLQEIREINELKKCAFDRWYFHCLGI